MPHTVLARKKIQATIAPYKNAMAPLYSNRANQVIYSWLLLEGIKLSGINGRNYVTPCISKCV